MKKIHLLIIALAVFVGAKAQWGDDSVNNTLIANCVNSANEIRIASHPYVDGIFVQWTSMSDN
ncbi:MAG: hypothetical protein SPK72_04530, partial [Bacteroidales bacterium]|nr:hypothetical protein [Bacteroidales bacterium]